METKQIIKELNIIRYFNATPLTLFNAWTHENIVAQWWGPKGFTNPICEMEARNGGNIRIDMQGPDGTLYPMIGTFREVDPNHYLHFTSSAFQNNEGDWDLVDETSVTFEKVGDRTKLTLHAVVTKAAPHTYSSLYGMEEGWKQSLDRLDALINQGNRKTDSARHHQLDILTGFWNSTGTILSGDLKGKTMRGIDTYEWLPGGFFILHTVDVMMGHEHIRSMEIIGWDETAGAVLARSFDGDGNYGKYTVDLRGHDLVITGARMRFNGRFENDGSQLNGIWEKVEGETWMPWMEIRLERDENK